MAFQGGHRPLQISLPIVPFETALRIIRGVLQGKLDAWEVGPFPRQLREVHLGGILETPEATVVRSGSFDAESENPQTEQRNPTRRQECRDRARSSCHNA